MKKSSERAATRRIVFAHGNSFGAGTYQQVFKVWRDAGYEVFAPERFGHDPRFPVSSNWPGLRDELIAFIEQSGGPACLVGHSLGGLLSLMAACKRPDLAQGLVMLDSPVITGWRAHSVQVFKRTGLIKKVSPGKVSQHRRHRWPDRDAVLAHFASKAVFARWDPQVLADYVATGFIEDGSELTLAFRREVETQIYNTLPHHLGRLLHRHPPQCPVAFIAGTRSAEIRQGGAEAAKALARDRFVWFEGTHLYPMERPADTATEVLRQIASMA